MNKGQNATAEKKANCPMEGNDEINDIVYKCDVTKRLPKKVYLGLAERERKSRFYNQNLSFTHQRYSNITCDTCKVFQLQNLTLSDLL